MNAVERLAGVVVDVVAVEEYRAEGGVMQRRWTCSALGLVAHATCLDDALVDLSERLAVRVGCDVERMTLRLVTQ